MCLTVCVMDIYTVCVCVCVCLCAHYPFSYWKMSKVGSTGSDQPAAPPLPLFSSFSLVPSQLPEVRKEMTKEKHTLIVRLKARTGSRSYLGFIYSGVCDDAHLLYVKTRDIFSVSFLVSDLTRLLAVEGFHCKMTLF